MPAAPTIRGPEDFAAAFDVSRETLVRLATYEKLLIQWQKAVNLVAPSTLGAVWHRHFADSAQLLALAPPGARHWIDLGSGAGFPGLVIAILLADTMQSAAPPPPRGGRAMRPRLGTGITDHPAGSSGRATPLDASGGGEPSSSQMPSHVTLIESDARKAAFLREVVRQTAIRAGVAVDILSIRAESARIKVNASLPRVICARALAPLEKLLELAAPLSPPGTTGLFCKGKGVARELQEAERTWKFNVELVPSITDSDGRIAVITNLDRKAKD
jgi:16S rRNA (guanine527-N7)-methyltransferase